MSGIMIDIGFLIVSVGILLGLIRWLVKVERYTHVIKIPDIEGLIRVSFVFENDPTSVGHKLNHVASGYILVVNSRLSPHKLNRMLPAGSTLMHSEGREAWQTSGDLENPRTYKFALKKDSGYPWITETKNELRMISDLTRIKSDITIDRCNPEEKVQSVNQSRINEICPQAIR